MTDFREFRDSLKARNINIPDEAARAIWDKHNESKESKKLFGLAPLVSILSSTSFRVTLGAIVILVAAVLLFRYDLQAVAIGDRAAIAYELDRWTGSVYYITPNGRWLVEEKK